MERFSKAYELLGLTADADMNQVKKAYRRLALKYHPDLNSDPKAHERFLLVKKAYDVIVTAEVNWTDGELGQSKQSKERRSKAPTKPSVSREEHIRKARARARKYDAMRMKQEAQEFARFKRSVLYPWTMGMSYLSLVFFFLIVADAFIVNRMFEGFVVEKNPVVFHALGTETTTGYQLVFKNGESVIVGTEPANRISVRSYVSLAETFIFRDIPKIWVVDDDFRSFEVDGFNKPPYLFFLIFIAVPIMVLIVDKPSAVFYSAGAFARYFSGLFILYFVIF